MIIIEFCSQNEVVIYFVIDAASEGHPASPIRSARSDADQIVTVVLHMPPTVTDLPVHHRVRPSDESQFGGYGGDLIDFQGSLKGTINIGK